MIDRPMKMPEPIIEPTTMAVASNRRRCLCNWRVWLMFLLWVVSPSLVAVRPLAMGGETCAGNLFDLPALKSTVV